nr:hypothetical protein [Marinicella sp. W31]MDC2878096.1 hypothetical protein [Marinicella sp. W31]
MHKSRVHDSAHKHVAGTAEYIDDIPEPAGLLHVGLGLSDRPHARVTAMDLSAVENAPGVVTVLTASDVTGVNDISSGGHHDEPLFANEEVEYHGQIMFAVIAETRHQARAAARLAEITYEDLPYWTNVRDALANEAPNVITPMTLKRGDAQNAIKSAPGGSPAKWRSAGRSISIWKARSRLPFPAKTTKSPCGPRHSIQVKSSISSAMCSTFRQTP